jgi:hypothetical protein
MVREGVIFAHKISEKGIVLESKVLTIEKLPLPHDVNGLRGFLGHVSVDNLLIFLCKD